MTDEVFAGRATYSEDLPLVMSRHGFEEETYFTFSFSPVVEPGGQVAGLLDTVVETTKRVLATRRLGVLQQLGSLPRSVHGSTPEAVAAALRVLAEARSDCPFGLVYLTGDAEAGRAARRRPGHRHRGRALDERHPRPGAGGHRHRRDRHRDRSGRAAAGPVQRRREPGRRRRRAHRRRPAADPRPGRAGPSAPSCSAPARTCRWTTSTASSSRLAAGQVAAAVADAQAVEDERRRAAERAELDRSRAQFFTDVAVTLQRAVLGPPSLPDGFAVHYEPATGTLEVGGDWYDVVDLPDGRYGVVVGDVVGRGLAAAAVMGQLRSAGRALLLESHSPAHVLSALDRFAALVPGAAVSTVFCAVIDPRDGAVRYSSAGHPPAIVAQADGETCFLEKASSLPLAVVDDLDRPEADVVLPPGSTLLLYTDGLVERRDEALDEGMARAADVLTAGPAPAAGGAGELLTEQLLDDAPDDDVAFLLYRCG